MKIFCIDVGNTTTHYGLLDGSTALETGEYPTEQFKRGPSKEFLSAVEGALSRSEVVSFCSVVPGINAHLRASLSPCERPIFHLTHENCPGLNLCYPRPMEIGQDRLANAIAAQSLYGTPSIVIDMGTAVTFDIISSQGYEGGLIAPGLGVMTHYLHEQTALLPALREDDLVSVTGGIGKSTVHAMQIGVAVGFSGMIEALLKRVTAELNESESKAPHLLATGGSIANLTADWTARTTFVENLTLIGLAEAARRR